MTKPRDKAATSMTDAQIARELLSLTWHRGQPAKNHSWRLFCRISESDFWQPRNEIRTQVQVYLTEPSKGWQSMSMGSSPFGPIYLEAVCDPKRTWCVRRSYDILANAVS